MSLDVTIRFKNKEGKDDFWSANITHNMGNMASFIPVIIEDFGFQTLYNYVWRPEEIKKKVDTTVMVKALTVGIALMIKKRKELLKYNPENGWGSYDSFLAWLIEYKNACEDHPGCYIEISR